VTTRYAFHNRPRKLHPSTDPAKTTATAATRLSGKLSLNIIVAPRMFSARTCGAPGAISNGWHQGDCSDFGCRVFYKCSEGFELIGKSERLCHSDGYWVPKDLPACVRKYFNSELGCACVRMPRRCCCIRVRLRFLPTCGDFHQYHRA